MPITEARQYIAERLRQLRTEKGLSTAEVGAIVGKSGKTISAWEVCHGSPGPDQLIALCRFYDVDISTFYDGEQTPFSVLSHDEKELITLYRRCTYQRKDFVLQAARDQAALSGDVSKRADISDEQIA